MVSLNLSVTGGSGSSGSARTDGRVVWLVGLGGATQNEASTQAAASVKSHVTMERPIIYYRQPGDDGALQDPIMSLNSLHVFSPLINLSF